MNEEDIVVGVAQDRQVVCLIIEIIIYALGSPYQSLWKSFDLSKQIINL